MNNLVMKAKHVQHSSMKHWNIVEQLIDIEMVRFTPFDNKNERLFKSTKSVKRLNYILFSGSSYPYKIKPITKFSSHGLVSMI